MPPEPGGLNSGGGGWRWCNKCQGLFYAWNLTTGACPAGGGHNYQGSDNYNLQNEPASNLENQENQDNWRLCPKCQGAWYSGMGNFGVCPAGGTHVIAGENYVLQMTGPLLGEPPGYAPNWCWCNKCEGLFFTGNPTSGTCPAGGGHNYDQSLIYILTQVPELS
jgi:Zn finger protein HypA/HybF involved in hydrogenase expression